MEISEILKELEFNTGEFPRKALEEAVARRQEITPELLRILEDARQNIEEIETQPTYMAHIFATYLLAQFREKRACRPIIEFFSIPGDITVDVTGDVVTEDLGRILASVCDGDTGPIEALIENRDANEYVRNAGLDALLTLVACGAKTRDEVMAYFQSLFRGKLEREPSYVWSGLVGASSELHPAEAMADIERAFEDDLIEEWSVDLGWVEERLATGMEGLLTGLGKDRHHQLVSDVVAETQWWGCFKRGPEQAAKDRETELPLAKSQSCQQPARARKIGRNEPCPCGSGKKYKRCCGR